MLNGTIGVQRLIAHLRTETTLASPVSLLHRRSIRAALALREQRLGVSRATVAATLSAALRPAISPDRAVPLAVAALLAATAFMAYQPASGGSIGGPDGDGPAPRIVIGGFGAGAAGVDDLTGGMPDPDVEPVVPVGDNSGVEPIDGNFVPVELPESAAVDDLSGPFLDDGTLLAGVAPDTSIPDGSAVLTSYKVQAGDTLTGIARTFGISMMTVWWANNLSSKDDLHVGQILRIPAVSGLVITVTEADSLESLAAKYKVETQAIVEANGLQQPVLIVGQTLIIPGALGASIATPTPAPARKPSSGGSVAPPSSYSGGAFVWPVVGGVNYLSQYFHYGHYGIDIAADRGSKVRAAASGRVIFAGWKSNGGGYQVWIAHGSNLYSTYNHMSGVSVGRGQSVARGQQVGRVGSSGYSTGPHLHFEVWKGAIWNGGFRVNPLRYF